MKASVAATAGKSVVKASRRSVATAGVENDGPDAAPHRKLGAHAVGPESVDPALFQCPGGAHAEIGAGAMRTGNRRDRHRVPLGIDAGFGEEAAQAHGNPVGGTNSAALHHAQIAASRSQVGTHHQEPVHALRLCAQKLDVAPFGKTGDEEVSRTTDEIQAAVAHGRERMLDRHDQFQGDVEPLAFEEAEFNCRNRREVGVRDQVRHREFHR